MAGGFEPGADLIVKIALLACLAIVTAGAGWWFFAARTDYATALGWVVDQPVPFSHEHHVSGLGLDCRFCHTSVETSATAGMPATETCMTCHSQLWTNAKLLDPMRTSFARHQPIVWNRVNAVPDYVYFNHSIHIAKGVGCSICHGDVGRMALPEKARSFEMQFCVNCHRDPGPNLRPAGAVFDTEWQRTAATPSPDALLASYHLGGRSLTDCSICHR
jgi:Cytochrome c7 and related cytochrome c